MAAIIGAGLSGLIAAHAFPKMQILEKQPQLKMQHKALLRFRSDIISRITDIPFQPVQVHKGIWEGGAFHQPSIRNANRYAIKLFGSAIGSRSIWNIEPVVRWVAPQDFYWQMAERLQDRIELGFDFDFSPDEIERLGGVINTSPLPIVLDLLGFDSGLEFQRAGIRVDRLKLKGVNLHQTIYFPGEETPTYRASITGNQMIIESLSESDIVFAPLAKAFGFHPLDIAEETEWAHQQSYGKIADVNNTRRQAIIHQLTSNFRIFSLGRFATWRNILLDDLADDISTIRSLMEATDYERSLIRTKTWHK